MNQAQALKEKLQALNQLVDLYLSAKDTVYHIEKEALLNACRLVYENIGSLSIEMEGKVVSAKQNNESIELKNEIEALKKELETLKSQTMDTAPAMHLPKIDLEHSEPKLETVAPVETIDDIAIDSENIEIATPYIEPKVIADNELVAPVIELEKKPEDAPIIMPVAETTLEVEPVIKTETIPEFKPTKKPALSLKLLIDSQRDGSINSSLNKPVENLKKAIGLNEKFLYIRELFDNNHQDFALLIDKLNEMNSLAEAELHLSENVMPVRNWDLENEHVQAFLTIVYRRFL
jgi:hypothetical protein